MIGIRLAGGAAALLASTSGAAQTAPWRISEASGRVVVRDAGGDHVVGRGAVVPAGSVLLTGAGARAVVVRGEDFVTVAANSRMRVPAQAQASGIVQMIEEWGSAVFRIKKQPNPHFGVQTPYLAAVVKGTTFSVTVTDKGAAVQVVEGAVEVATNDGGAKELVRPGALASVVADDRFRLTVQGETTKVLDSPARATGASAEAPASTTQSTEAGVDAPVAGESAATEMAEAMVVAPISAKPVDLGALTGGMVSGRLGAEIAALVTPAAIRSVEPAAERPESPAEPPAVPAGNDSAPADDKGPPVPPAPEPPAMPGSPNKPDDTGKPADPGKPDEAGKPADPGKPDDAGKPADPGKPDDAGKPADGGKPGDSGKPDKDADKPGKDEKPDKDDGNSDKGGKPGGDKADRDDDDDDKSDGRPGKGGEDDDDDDDDKPKGGKSGSDDDDGDDDDD